MRHIDSQPQVIEQLSVGIENSQQTRFKVWPVVEFIRQRNGHLQSASLESVSLVFQLTKYILCS